MRFFEAVRRTLVGILAVIFLLSMTPQAARGQNYQDNYQDNYDDDVDQIVARVSFLQGPISFARGDDPDNWDPAVVNIPFGLGDKLYSSADGRAELTLPGGNFVRIGRRSYISALTLTYDTKQFYVGNGAATFNIRRLDRDEIFEVDTPSVAVTLDQPGRYRVEVDDNGDTRVIVRSGVAYVAANGRQVTVERAEIRIYGLDAAEYEIVALRAADTFDRWVDERQARFDARFRDAYQYADEEIVGMEDLADNGRWEDIPEYGRAWTPTVVAAGWQPFTVGHFYWQDPWGWSWISEEPWGWAPCHYGRWTFYRSRWYWVPVRRGTVVVRYAPAVVEFVPVRGYIGWFPLHPRDRFVPWWSRRERNIETVNFVNRTRVVVVDERTFVSSRRVTTNIVRDTTIIREVTTVRTIERRAPVPQRESIRVVSERRQVERPPAAIVSRPVVVRTAPLPPPPRFDEKVKVIRERQGQPLSTREIVDLGAKDFKSNRRMQIRTVTESKTDFKSRGGQGSQAVQTQPIAPIKGREVATPDKPVKTEVTRRQQRDQQRDDRQNQQQQQKAQEQQQRDLQKQQEDQDRLQKKQERDQDQLQKKQERDREKEQKQLQDQQRKDQEQQRDLQRKQQDQDRLQKQQQQDQDRKDRQLQDQQRKDLERKQQDQDRLQKQQERDQKQLQDQQRKDQEQQQKDLQRKQQDQDRLQKQQKQDQDRKDRQLQDQQRKDQEQQQKDLQRKQQDQDRLQKQQQQDQDRKDRQLQDQQRKDQEEQQQKDLQRKQQDQDRLQKQQKQDQDRKDRQLQDQQRKDQEQQQKDLQRKQQEQDRLQQQRQQDQERKDQQRQQQQQLQDQKKQEQDQRRQELERQRQEQLQQKQNQDQQRREQLQQQKERKGQPPSDDRPPRAREKKKDENGNAQPPPPPGPPPGPPPR